MEEDFKSVKKRILLLQQTTFEGLNFVSLDFEAARLVLLTAASFENAEWKKSHLRYVLLVAGYAGAETSCT